MHPAQAVQARITVADVGRPFSDEALTQLATEVYANRKGPHDQETITRLQRQLRQVGYDPGPIDGLLGPRTLEALQRFLMDRGLDSGTASHITTPVAPDS
jgi:peptidoglycan hydrolase-like protein with peptidoglycan-binding domain